jgi:hypothetical protein
MGSGARLSESDVDENGRKKKYEVINEENSADTSGQKSKMTVSQDQELSEEDQHESRQSSVDNNQLGAQLAMADPQRKTSAAALSNLGASVRNVHTGGLLPGEKANDSEATKANNLQAHHHNTSSAMQIPVSKSLTKSSKKIERKNTQAPPTSSRMSSSKRDVNQSKQRYSTYDIDEAFEAELDEHIKCFSVLLNRIR